MLTADYEPLKITILDATGQEVESIIYTEGAGKLALGSTLKSGLYFIRVNGVKTFRSFKVLKE